MTPLERKLVATLRKYTTDLTARGILRRAQERRSETNGNEASFEEAVLYGARLFVEEPERSVLLAELREVFNDALPLPDAIKLQVVDEHSARRARLAVRRVAEQAGANKLITLRAATALSELTRNVLMYVGRGEVEISLIGTPPRVRVVVSDQGPGIPNLEEVMSGRYQSKTGMGRGLTGVQKLADAFHIDAGPTGTRVEFEMDL